MRDAPPVVLAIGGTDSGGHYGLQADQRTLAALGVHAAIAVTVLTAQNSIELRQAQAVPVDFVMDQIRAVLDDLPVVAVKTGMLGRADLIEAIASLAASGELPNLVVDPVLVNRHGAPVFGDVVREAYINALVPYACLVTPNRDELGLLTGRSVQTVDDLEAGCRLLGSPTLATGGRLDGEQVTDVFWDGTCSKRFSGERVATLNVAGTGDCLSAAVAGHLAYGLELAHAVDTAISLVRDAVSGSAKWSLGSGNGPIDILGAAWTRSGRALKDPAV